MTYDPHADAHSIANLSIEKGILMHSLDDAVVMLTDALHALRRGRLNVADEFLERTVEALKQARAAEQAHVQARRPQGR